MKTPTNNLLLLSVEKLKLGIVQFMFTKFEFWGKRSLKNVKEVVCISLDTKRVGPEWPLHGVVQLANRAYKSGAARIASGKVRTDLRGSRNLFLADKQRMCEPAPVWRLPTVPAKPFLTHACI